MIFPCKKYKKVQLKRTNFTSELEAITFAASLHVQPSNVIVFFLFFFCEKERDSPNGDGSFRVSARHPRRVLGRLFCVGRVTASRSFHARNLNGDGNAHQPSRQKRCCLSRVLREQRRKTRKEIPADPSRETRNSTSRFPSSRWQSSLELSKFSRVSLRARAKFENCKFRFSRLVKRDVALRSFFLREFLFLHVFYIYKISTFFYRSREILYIIIFKNVYPERRELIDL